MKATVIIPTVGDPHLYQAVKSVVDQSVPTYALLIIDGQEHEEKVMDNLSDLFFHPNVRVVTLPWNTHQSRHYGTRILASFPHVIPTPFTLFLDQDNYYSPNHVESLVELMTNFRLDWACSLRNVLNIGPDLVESTGPHINAFSSNHIDTNCWCFRTAVLVAHAHHWRGFYDCDKLFTRHAMQYLPNYGCTNLPTLNYRLGNNPNLTEKFFSLSTYPNYTPPVIGKPTVTRYA